MDPHTSTTAMPGKWQRIIRNRWVLRGGVVVILVILLWSARRPILRSIGDLLIRTDQLHHADALYVLGGSPIDRTLEGMELVREGYAPAITFTGESPNEILQLFGIDSSEAALGERVAMISGFDSTRIQLLKRGTSTFEEAEAVHDRTLALHQDTIIVVTTEFHTRRVGQVFRKAMTGSGITVIVHAAHSMHYDADHWWHSEEGLLMVNNEYMKLMYYAIKH
ncbi:MAG: YdcF family protein [Flavobacteriales bacterium]|nr:YdcF family protein [Flavobacteriales bacterium]MCC6938132.1 YdcF family protein [Flavobacteriales bacterium]